MEGLIGKKLGMTRVFDDAGMQVPVTVLQVGPCVIVQRKSREKDGYEAVQLGFEDQKSDRLTRPLQGHFKKAGVDSKRVLQEVSLDDGEDVKVGDTVTVASVFEGVNFVDVIAMTKGRGYQGVVRRHGMSGGRASHGSSMHRRGGSIGQCEWPARVFKNRKMPGQMGNTRVTTQNLKIQKIRDEDNVILVRGAVPGPAGAIVMVRKAIKKPSKVAEKS